MNIFNTIKNLVRRAYFTSMQTIEEILKEFGWTKFSPKDIIREQAVTLKVYQLKVELGNNKGETE